MIICVLLYRTTYYNLIQSVIYSLMNSTLALKQLRRDHPYPKTFPNIKVDFGENWFLRGNALLLKKYLSPDLPGDTKRQPQLIVELGVWKGRSTDFMLRVNGTCTIICIDMWQGDQSIGNRSNVTEQLYTQCMRNLWPHRKRVIPLRMDGRKAIAYLYKRGIRPDLIYLDMGHTYNEVRGDLAVLMKYYPDVLTLGDDILHHRDGVARAVKDCVMQNKTTHHLEVNENCYALVPREYDNYFEYHELRMRTIAPVDSTQHHASSYGYGFGRCTETFPEHHSSTTVSSFKPLLQPIHRSSSRNNQNSMDPYPYSIHPLKHIAVIVAKDPTKHTNEHIQRCVERLRDIYATVPKSCFIQVYIMELKSAQQAVSCTQKPMCNIRKTRCRVRTTGGLFGYSKPNNRRRVRRNIYNPPRTKKTTRQSTRHQPSYHDPLVSSSSSSSNTFNKGLLYNAGFVYAMMEGKMVDSTTCSPDAYLFQDPLCLPDDKLAKYYRTYPEKPIQLGFVHSQFMYDKWYFGSMFINANDYCVLNGYPNNIIGWDGWDNELVLRLKSARMEVLVPQDGTIQPGAPPVMTIAEWKSVQNKQVTDLHTRTWRFNGINCMPKWFPTSTNVTTNIIGKPRDGGNSCMSVHTVDVNV